MEAYNYNKNNYDIKGVSIGKETSTKQNLCSGLSHNPKNHIRSHGSAVVIGSATAASRGVLDNASHWQSQRCCSDWNKRTCHTTIKLMTMTFMWQSKKWLESELISIIQAKQTSLWWQFEKPSSCWAISSHGMIVHVLTSLSKTNSSGDGNTIFACTRYPNRSLDHSRRIRKYEFHVSKETALQEGLSGWTIFHDLS